MTSKAVITRATLRCPVCGAEREERMPTDACQFFYECPACGTLLRPRAGDCCVFCSYASVPCPIEQRRRERLTGGREMQVGIAAMSAA